LLNKGYLCKLELGGREIGGVKGCLLVFCSNLKRISGKARQANKVYIGRPNSLRKISLLMTAPCILIVSISQLGSLKLWSNTDSSFKQWFIQFFADCSKFLAQFNLPLVFFILYSILFPDFFLFFKIIILFC